MQNEELVFWEIKQKQVSLFKTRADICHWGGGVEVLLIKYIYIKRTYWYIVLLSMYSLMSLLGLKNVPL